MNAKNESLFDVMGMTCHSCVRHIDHALRELAGVTKVEVLFREGKVRVQHDASEAPIESLIEAMREAGYESTVAAAA